MAIDIAPGVNPDRISASIPPVPQAGSLMVTKLKAQCFFEGGNSLY